MLHNWEIIVTGTGCRRPTASGHPVMPSFPLVQVTVCSKWPCNSTAQICPCVRYTAGETLPGPSFVVLGLSWYACRRPGRRSWRRTMSPTCTSMSTCPSNMESRISLKTSTNSGNKFNTAWGVGFGTPGDDGAAPFVSAPLYTPSRLELYRIGLYLGRSSRNMLRLDRVFPRCTGSTPSATR